LAMTWLRQLISSRQVQTSSEGTCTVGVSASRSLAGAFHHVSGGFSPMLIGFGYAYRPVGSCLHVELINDVDAANDDRCAARASSASRANPCRRPCGMVRSRRLVTRTPSKKALDNSAAVCTIELIQLTSADAGFSESRHEHSHFPQRRRADLFADRQPGEIPGRLGAAGARG